MGQTIFLSEFAPIALKEATDTVEDVVIGEFGKSAGRHGLGSEAGWPEGRGAAGPEEQPKRAGGISPRRGVPSG